MIVVSDQNKADLNDYYKSAVCCAQLELGFSMEDPEDPETEGNIYDPAGVAAGIALVFGVLDMTLPEVTDADLAEFKVANGM